MLNQSARALLIATLYNAQEQALWFYRRGFFIEGEV
jgi:hypothetical protein